MKIATIFGTRPEIIRLSQVIRRLDEFAEQTLIHTGQNYDPSLSDIFFKELNVRQPDIHLGIQSSGFADQIGQIISKSGEVFQQIQPDRVLILGDTNSGLAAIVAARMGIPVYHMEAGNRCYDDRVPEEINRRVIDHSSKILMPYTQRSAENLVREGIDRHRIFITGNPIYEVLENYAEEIDASSILRDMNLVPQQYFLVTMHRAENVDERERLNNMVDGLNQVAENYKLPMIVSLHPRTADKIEKYEIGPISDYIKLIEPVGLFDFVHLEKNAKCVISDSGTVQEECAIFNVPNITIRDVTERPETVEAGSNILVGGEPELLVKAVDFVTKTSSDWKPPQEYVKSEVSLTVTRIMLSYKHY